MQSLKAVISCGMPVPFSTFLILTLPVFILFIDPNSLILKISETLHPRSNLPENDWNFFATWVLCNSIGL